MISASPLEFLTNSFGESTWEDRVGSDLAFELEKIGLFHLCSEQQCPCQKDPTIH